MKAYRSQTDDAPLKKSSAEAASADRENAIEYILARLGKYIKRQDITFFITVFVLGLLVHLYMFTHKFINHDDVWCLYSSCEFGLSSGRWLLQFLTELTGAFSSSWINGLVGIFCLAIGVVFVARIFEVRHYASGFLIALIMVTFPAVATTYSYMFCSYQYLVALALSAMGAYYIRKNSFLALALGSVLIALAMGCYQAYFAFAAVLLVTVLAYDICADRYHGDTKKAYITAIRYVLALALGIALYFVILKLCLFVTGTELTQYQGIADMGHIGFWQLLRSIASAYYHFFTFYLNGNVFRSSAAIIVFASLVLSLAAVCITVKRNRVYHSFPIMLLLIADIVLVPLAADLVYVMVAGNGAVHTVMQYAMAIPLIMPAVFADKMTLSHQSRDKSARKRLSAVFAALLMLVQLVSGYELFLLTNRVYFDIDITYENVYAYYVKLTAKLELQEGFAKDSPVAFVGTASIDTPVEPTYLMGVMTDDDAANIYSRTRLLSYFLASEYNWASSAQLEAVMSSDEFQMMPCYPSEGSIKTINGVIVVKFS